MVATILVWRGDIEAAPREFMGFWGDAGILVVSWEFRLTCQRENAKLIHVGPGEGLNRREGPVTRRV